MSESLWIPCGKIHGGPGCVANVRREDAAGNHIRITRKFSVVKMAMAWWFQQDGAATAHTARETMQLLRSFLGERTISRYGNVNWPSHSPDLTRPELFLWRYLPAAYLKERVYVNKPETLEQLKNINREIKELGSETLEGVMVQVLERIWVCKSKNGRHLNNVIFHTRWRGVAKRDQWILISIMSFKLYQNLMNLSVKLRKLLKIESPQWLLVHLVYVWSLPVCM